MHSPLAKAGQESTETTSSQQYTLRDRTATLHSPASPHHSPGKNEKETLAFLIGSQGCALSAVSLVNPFETILFPALLLAHWKCLLRNRVWGSALLIRIPLAGRAPGRWHDPTRGMETVRVTAWTAWTRRNIAPADARDVSTDKLRERRPSNTRMPACYSRCRHNGRILCHAKPCPLSSKQPIMSIAKSNAIYDDSTCTTPSPSTSTYTEVTPSDHCDTEFIWPGQVSRYSTYARLYLIIGSSPIRLMQCIFSTLSPSSRGLY
eukprot:s643_g8.t1